MKIRKIFAAAIIIIYTAGVIFCNFFGAKLRDALSPRAEYVYPESVLADGRYLYSIPAEALITDDSGGQFVLIAEVSDKYPERCYEARKREAEAVGFDGENAIIGRGIKTGDRVIIGKILEDGQRVVISERGDYK